MTEYVSKDAVIKEVRSLAECELESVATQAVAGRIAKLLEDIPPEDVRPVARGEWHQVELGRCLCSECGQRYSNEMASICNYCCKCGADMRENKTGRTE